MKKLMQLFVLGFVLFNTACTPIGIEGSGNIISEKRAIAGNVHIISVSSTIQVTLLQGDSLSVVAQSDDNLLPFLETTLNGDALMIRHKDNVNLRNMHAAVTITVPQLKGIQMGGTSTLKMPKPFHFQDLQVISSGTGAVILQGSVRNLEIKQSSTGKIKAFDCPAEKVDIHNFGTGNTEVNVLREMFIVLGGTGDIIFKGNPLLMSSQISGTGQLKRF